MQQQQDKNEINKRPRGSKPGDGKRQSILIRYGKMKMLAELSCTEKILQSGTKHVIVNTDRGMEIAEVVSCYQCTADSMLTPEKVESYCRQSDADYPLTHQGKIVRIATEQDVKEQRHLDANVKNEIRFCEDLIGEMNLPMQLVDAEHLFGGERIIFYFMSEGRVDFRDLVKQLAQQYQTRIEMRQVGARDEARLIADYETCGRICCCKSFLKILQPVNMRMAKQQKATLDPSKISGRCGRLKCCLRYEDIVYCELKKKLPRRNTCVLTEKGYGIVIETQILTQLVKVRLVDEKIIAVAMNEILQFDCEMPRKDSLQGEKPAGEKRGDNDRPRSEPAVSKERQNNGVVEEQRNNGDRRNGRERTNEQPGNGNGGGKGNGNGGVPDVAGDGNSTASARKKRRRRRKKRPAGANDNPNPSVNGQ
jgi:cell fate regulator YaaT (PSP1 superfamily)